MRRRTPPQIRIANSPKRFNVAAWGRQSGKTTFGLDKMIWKPLQGPEKAIYWYVLQTHGTAEIAFDRYSRMTHRTGLLTRKPHETAMRFDLVGNRWLFFKSGKNFEDLRAETLHGAIIDEVRQQNKELWPMVIRPMLARTGGWCDFLSTTNGFDHFFDLYEFAKSHPKEWGAHHAPSTEAWWWTDEEIASARATMTEEQFRQEIMSEFVNLYAGQAYRLSQDNLVTQNPFAKPGERISPWLPIVVGLDFNVNPMAWTLGQFRNGSPHGYFHWFDEIWLRQTNTPECAPLLAQKILDLKKNHGLRAEPNVIIAGDPAGKSRNSKATESDYNIIEQCLKDHGITFENRTAKSAPPVKDRINTINTYLKNANGTVNMTLNPETCPKAKHDLERVSWKEGSKELALDKSDPDLTHSSDGIGYPVCVLAPLEGVNAVGTLGVIKRSW